MRLLMLAGRARDRPGVATAHGDRGTRLPLLTGGTVITMDGGHRILQAGRGADRRQRHRRGRHVRRDCRASSCARETIDTTGKIVLPGLVNTHGHAPMVLYRGLADDLALMEWLQKYIFPAEAKTVSPEMVRVGTRLAALEMIQSGTTTFADMYYFEEEIAAVDAGRRACAACWGRPSSSFPCRMRRRRPRRWRAPRHSSGRSGAIR